MKKPLHRLMGVTFSSPRSSPSISPFSRRRSSVERTACWYMLATRPKSPFPRGIPMGAVALHSLSLSAGPFPRRVWPEAESERRGVCSAGTTVELVELEGDRSMVGSGEAREGDLVKLFLAGWRGERVGSSQLRAK